MSLIALGVAIALVAYAAVNVLVTMIAIPLSFTIAKRSEPVFRARSLAILRLLPSAAAGFVVAGFVLPAFGWLEPRQAVEPVTSLMAGLAFVGALMLLTGAARGLASILSTRRLVKRWNHDSRAIDVPGIKLPAFEIDEPFPIVSLVGWFRPRVMMARSVLESCDRDELAAIVAHEVGHYQRRDPWVRLFIRACPDITALTPWAYRLERAWADAAEEDADELAARSGESRAMDLASALVKVARLADSGLAPATVVAALYRGEGIGSRVARLLEREPGREADGVWGGALGGVAALVAIGLVPAAAVAGIHHEVHRLVEALVRLLQ